MHFSQNKQRSRGIIAALLVIWMSVLFALPVSAEAKASFQLDQTVVSQNSTCTVRYYHASSGAWIGVYPQGNVSNSTLLFSQDLKRGKIGGYTELKMDLSAGQYTMVYYQSSKTEAERLDFEVTRDTFYGDSRTYAENTNGVFYLSTDVLGTDSWIGIYPEGEFPESSECLVWGYLPSGTSQITTEELDEGTWKFRELPVGEYTAYYFSDASYETTSSFSFSVTETQEMTAYYQPTRDIQPGMAGGQIVVNSNSIDEGQYYWLYWGDETGVLEDYRYLDVIDLEERDYSILADNLTAPEGADRFYLYPGNEKEADLSSEPYVIPMPEDIQVDDGKMLTSFTLITDTHLTHTASHEFNQHYKKVLRDIKSNMRDTSAIINLGDITNNGRESEYQQLEKIMATTQYNLPDMYYIMGNHDYALNKYDPEGQQELFLEYTGMPDLYYSFESQGYTYICLSSEGYPEETELSTVDAYLSEEQLAWLQEELATAAEENPDQPIFVFLHQPLQNTVSLSENSSIIQNDELREILDAYPQVVYFSGHTHCAVDVEQAVYDGHGEGASMVHAGCTSHIWDVELEDYESTQDGSQGCLVEVYEDHIRIRGRDFANGLWIGSAEYILYTNGNEVVE